jgi:hypothetical protein
MISALMALASGCDATFDFAATSVAVSVHAPDGGSADVVTPEDAGSDRGVGFAPPCHKDDDCPVSKLHCNLATAQCVECLGDRHCVVSQYPFCDTAVERCVGCLSTSDCRANEICNPNGYVCIVKCAAASNCPIVQPLCNAEGLCAECVNGDECGQHQVCDFKIGRCVGCIDGTQCAAPTPYCDLYNPEHTRCKECLSSSDCPADRPYCDLHGGLCVALTALVRDL